MDATYNDSNFDFTMIYNKHANKILTKILIEKLWIKDSIIIEYDIILNQWKMLNDYAAEILYTDLINMLTKILILKKYNYDIVDGDEITLIYDKLLDKKYKYDPEAKAYRMGYRFLKNIKLFNFD